MQCSGARNPLKRLLRDVSRGAPGEIPLFLVPTLARAVPSSSTSCSSLSLSSSSSSSSSRPFSSSSRQQSRIGSAPISVPPEVSLRFFELPRANIRSRKADVPTTAVEIVGPLGQMTLSLPPYLHAQHNEETKKVTIQVADRTIAHQRAMWGTMRAHMQNYISGVSEGHVSVLRMVGVGYRATIEEAPTTTKQAPAYAGQKFVSLKLGFAHPVELGVPRGVTASVPQPTRILLHGCDRQAVAQFAAAIRRWRPPEPYKGKGIFVDDETIKVKAKKIK